MFSAVTNIEIDIDDDLNDQTLDSPRQGQYVGRFHVQDFNIAQLIPSHDSWFVFVLLRRCDKINNPYFEFSFY